MPHGIAVTVTLTISVGDITMGVACLGQDLQRL